MALNKQKIAMPIVDGIDTKGDSKTVLPTRFLELENVIFTNPGSIQKRFGYEALPNKDLDLNTISTGSAVSSFRDELLLYSNSNLYSYSEGEQKWEGKGEIKFCSSSSLQISADNSILENPNAYTYENITCYAYEKKILTIEAGILSSPTLYSEYKNIQIVIVDNITNTILAKHELKSQDFGSLIGGSILAPKVGFSGSKFIVTYMCNFVDGLGGGFRFSTVDYLNPKVISNSNIKISTASGISIDPDISLSTFKYDLQTISNRVFIAYTTLALDTVLKSIDENQDISPAFSLATNYVLNNVSISKEGSNVRTVLTKSDGTLAQTYLVNFSLTAPFHAPVTLTTIPLPATSTLDDANDGKYTITAVEDPNNSTQSIIFIQVKAWKTRLGAISTAIITNSGVQSAFSPTVAHIGLELQSKPVSLEGYVYFFASKNVDPRYTASGILSNGDIDPAYEVNKPVRTLYLIKNLLDSTLDFKTEILGQYDVDENCFINSDYVNGLTNVDLNGLVITKPSAVITSLQPAGASKVLASTVIKKQIADFSQSSNYFDVSQGEALHISGGLLKMYDGYKVVEHGFLDIPEAPKDIDPVTDLIASTSDGLDASKRYLYSIVYKWTDRTGKIHRSSPSLPISVTTPAGTKFLANLSFIPCYLTSKNDVEIEIYRTQGNGTIFYKISKVVDTVNTPGTDDFITGSYANIKNKKFISITDYVTDQELAYAEPLYTTGGVLENDAALSSSYVASYKARTFLILSDGFTLQYSKVTGIGEPVRFNAAFKIPLDDKGGKATALAVVDDHLIIFKERAIFALTGEGPNELGQQDDYRTPYNITSDAGCIDANSLVENPEGIMFKSSKGIYMLKRNFGLQYIGDSVEAYNNEKITSATLLSTANQIRLITETGKALVYDYYTNRWSTFTNIRGLDSIEFKGVYHYVRADGLVYKETKGQYQDNGQFIKMRIKSAWIQIAGVQGFERFYQMMFLGNYKSAHKLLIKFAYDFNPFYQQETTINTEDVLNPSTYGTGTYGTGVYGGEFPLYQWQVYPKIQKCQSFQFELQDFKTTVDGESFSLSHIMAEVGVKNGSFKTSGNKSFGTK
jgi:hypothetical protein